MPGVSRAFATSCPFRFMRVSVSIMFFQVISFLKTVSSWECSCSRRPIVSLNWIWRRLIVGSDILSHDLVGVAAIFSQAMTILAAGSSSFCSLAASSRVVEFRGTECVLRSWVSETHVTISLWRRILSTASWSWASA
jgi:hypothetical protein